MDETVRNHAETLPFPLIRRVAVFAALFACMQLSWQALRGTPIERFVIDDITVQSAQFWVNLLTPHVQARAAGGSLLARGGSINILNGCEGMEALFLLLAAFAVAPLSRISRLRGALLGLIFVYVINQLRILGLFYANRADHAMFDPLHAIIMPIAVVLLITGYFYVWLVRASSPPSAAT